MWHNANGTFWVQEYLSAHCMMREGKSRFFFHNEKKIAFDITILLYYLKDFQHYISLLKHI
jgi:hypothetical protein